MKTLGLLVIPGLMLSTICGCGARNEPPTPPAASAPVVVVADQATRGVAVLGRGEVVAIPDTAYIEIGVEAQGTTVAQARSSGAKAMNDLIDSTLKNGVARADIQTSQLSIGPQYDASGTRIVGYTMTTSITIKLRDLDKLSSTIDDAVKAGRNLSRVDGIRFSVDDAAALRDRAREAAINDARRKAEQIAKVSGAKLGGLLTIEEALVQTSPVPTMTFEGGDAQKTPIERGSASVAVEVRARWAISS